ncbi:hypothetical protein [Roseovarius rhodophyticola]|uniref:Uncharacterized protein n=1 Tax=Roseovarius rhodophyticola TaxID=3080827 RepID=A0ABZ2TDA7_9RHOB|nr:hypothetical protein [Roseovarius sp. W115]MDV2931430.1 hypothetical protein [Roseovarius sp. W115]
MSDNPKEDSWSLRTVADRVREQIALPALPKLGREVNMPVYLIHNSADPEDYFFIFDFEQFVEQTRAGLFVRPKMKIWAGRQDFDRRAFARQMRESFAREFDIARAQLAANGGKAKGWFGFLGSSVGEVGSLSGFVANVVLLVALSAGKMVLSQVLPKNWIAGKSDARKLEDGIDATKNKVDSALQDVEITLHRDLYNHAYRGQTAGRLTGMDYQAWPLPAHVKQHLNDETSGSWW